MVSRTHSSGRVCYLEWCSEPEVSQGICRRPLAKPIIYFERVKPKWMNINCSHMGNAEVPKELPKCELIQVLAKKISQREDLDFYPLGRLDEFRQKVSGEVRQINELFPEYTPHDEQYHLKRLFYVADTVLGRDLIKEMNAAELFVLAVALYGHDWGMAVNEIEKNYIISGTIPKDVKPEDLSILPDEKNRFNTFVRNQQLVDKDNKIKDIPVEKWREYVRQTHAFRSGIRIGKFFEPIDGGVADAASRVCVGHWLDFEELQDHDSYPINYSVMREGVNLRALAVYLRLIDLLDLADDRTPYVIWKFVAPRNARSKMAWDKHRALRPVICPSYQGGRVIRVDGSTDNHEVYAALEDLRIWCEKQFKGCNDVLARLNDSHHKLDIYHIDWHVEARGFKKTSIGFQFDRERMFEILGKEIYQGDPYVFLRELLQNSIDAIRMRREILRKHAKIEPGNLGVIRVNVEHLDNKDIIVTWSDDGIGMDEYIIQNYLAVAGKSYYRSPDFEKVGLEMDPISRFGIGILSCFIVANQIEIETYRGPHLKPISEPLKITIPDQSKQFRVETNPEGCSEIGTTVRVFVESKEISNLDKNNPIDSLNVTEYLSIIAGFVEFPIVIDENDKKTIIIHPKQDAVTIKQRFGEEYRVHTLNLSYPWSEAIMPQDLATAHELLREECFDIRSDLGVDGIDGVLAYLVPINDDIDISTNKGEVQIRGQSIISKAKSIRNTDNWSTHYESRVAGLCRSSEHYSSYSVYKDGILVPYASPPLKFWGNLLKPLLLVNLSMKKAPIIDVSRTDFSVGSGDWYTHIYQLHIKKIMSDNLEKLLSLNPLDRLYQMGRIVAFHKIDPLELWKVFPHKYWPIVFLQPGGYIDAFEFGDISGKQIKLFPETIDTDELYRLFYRGYMTKHEPEGPLVKWKGDPVLI